METTPLRGVAWYVDKEPLALMSDLNSSSSSAPTSSITLGWLHSFSEPPFVRLYNATQHFYDDQMREYEILFVKCLKPALSMAKHCPEYLPCFKIRGRHC